MDYSPGQFGMFIASAFRMQEQEYRSRISEIFIGSRVEPKEVQKLVAGKGSKTKKPSQAEKKASVANLSKALKGLK